MTPVTFEEYFYKKLCDLEIRQDELTRLIRTKRGLLPLLFELWQSEIEKATLEKLYSELKQLL